MPRSPRVKQQEADISGMSGVGRSGRMPPLTLEAPNVFCRLEYRRFRSRFEGRA